MRLTKRDGNKVWFEKDRPRGFHCPREFCDNAYVCKKVKDRTCPYLQLMDKLATYEDIGFEPEEVAQMGNALKLQSVMVNEASHYWSLQQQGRLVILPCKVGDTVWFYLYEDRGGVRKGIYKGIIAELKAVQRLNRDAPLFLAYVRFEYPDPWYSFEKLSTSEMHCSFGEYGSWVQFYLTREEAEAALKGETEDV